MMLEVGRITRPHGVRGEVSVVLTTNRTERVAPGSVLQGAGRRFEVVASRPHKGGYIVAFDGIGDRAEAEAVRGMVLSAEPIDDPAEVWVHDLVGAQVVDQSGTAHGRVVQVIDNPASDLLELDSGALVPMRFVTSITPGETVTVDVPDGLFDLDRDDP